MTSPRTLAVLLLVALPGCGRTGGSAAQQADDTTYAVQLLARAGVTVERAAVQRVLRDDHETVVWVEPRVQGLPVFDQQQGYSFEGDRPPTLLGEPIPHPPPGRADQPRITAAEARAAFYRRAAQQRWVLAPDDPLSAVLGYVAGPAGYRLAWRVRPLASGTQALMVTVDAMDGGEIFWDSGIRCTRAPCP